MFRRGSRKLKDAKGGRADGDNLRKDLFFNYLGMRCVKYLRCIVGCQTFDHFTGCAIRMIPHIGMMMK